MPQRTSIPARRTLCTRSVPVLGRIFYFLDVLVNQYYGVRLRSQCCQEGQCGGEHISLSSCDLYDMLYAPVGYFEAGIDQRDWAVEYLMLAGNRN
jgi:hypothetical protein